MAVNPPESGDVITPSSIETMHEQVRTVVNALQVGNLGRGSLRHDQLPSLVEGYDTVDIVADATVPLSATFGETTWAADWIDLTNGGSPDYVLDNSGAGYVLPNCILVAWATLRISGVSSGGDSRHQLWFNLYFNNGSDHFDETDNRVVVLGDAYTIIYEPENVVTMVWAKPFPAGTLEHIKIRTTAQRSGGAVPGAPFDWTVGNGHMGFVALKQPE